jgi:hypothetical protein
MPRAQVRRRPRTGSAPASPGPFGPAEGKGALLGRSERRKIGIIGGTEDAEKTRSILGHTEIQPQATPKPGVARGPAALPVAPGMRPLENEGQGEGRNTYRREGQRIGTQLRTDRNMINIHGDPDRGSRQTSQKIARLRSKGAHMQCAGRITPVS